MHDLSFYKNKKVLITGHTGFKGSWLCEFLLSLGADVYGYALEAEEPSLYRLSHLDQHVHSYIGDVRDFQYLKEVFDIVQPDIVFHLAAQPIVRTAYEDPRYTYDVNVMGTVNLLECIRLSSCVKSIVNVTTDKVYKNIESQHAFEEDDELNGNDPYANSKSCSELISDTYRNAYFANQQIALSTVRSGNVIGGGDFGEYRIIPDCLRAIMNDEETIIRHPESIRPYQHVLEALYAYLLIGMRQYNDLSYCGSYNVGPEEKDMITTEQLVQTFSLLWSQNYLPLQYKIQADQGPKEAQYLQLNTNKIKNTFAWAPTWNIAEALQEVIHWFDAYQKKEDIHQYLQSTIIKFLNKDKSND